MNGPTPAGINQKSQQRWLAVFSFLITPIVLFVFLGPALLSPKVYNCDTRQHVSWMAVYQDPQLFPNDWGKHYFFDAFCLPAYRGIFAVFSPWCDVQSIAEVLGVILSLISACLAYRIGRALLPDEATAGLAALVWFLIAGNISFDAHLIRWLQGGLQRAFLVPAFFMALLGWLTNRHWLAGVGSIVGALYYPPTSIMIGAIWLPFLILNWRKDTRRPSNWLWFLASNIVAVAIMTMSKPSGWTNYTLQEALNLPDFFDPPVMCYDGSLHHTLWPYLTALFPFPVWLSTALIIVIAWLAIRRAALPWSPMLSIVIGSGAGYALAMLLYNRLYEPNRYLFPMRCLFLIVAPFVAAELLTGLSRIVRWRPSIQLIRIAVVSGLIVAAFGAAFVGHRRYQRGEGGVSGILPDSAYEFLRILPKDVTIAGHPLDIGDIPIRSQRQVLLQCEGIFPVHKEFYEEVKRRYVDTLRAMYSPDFAPMLNLRERYHADYLVIDDRLTPDLDRYRAGTTFADVYRELETALKDKTPAARRVPNDAIVFSQDGCTIISLAKLAALNPN